MKKSILTVLLVSCFLLSAHAQETMQKTIQDQFHDFYKQETSTWQEYRMMKVPKLKSFWAVVTDTIRVKEQKINASLAKIKSLNAKLNHVNHKLIAINSELAVSEVRNESIVFMGVQLRKSVYNTMVWLLILGFISSVGIFYFMYLRSNKITKESRLALSNVEEEYTAHKDKARDAQLKLKRELQTDLNTLQEHRIKI